MKIYIYKREENDKYNEKFEIFMECIYIVEIVNKFSTKIISEKSVQ